MKYTTFLVVQAFVRENLFEDEINDLPAAELVNAVLGINWDKQRLFPWD